jgi:hypothetical protein
MIPEYDLRLAQDGSWSQGYPCNTAQVNLSYNHLLVRHIVRNPIHYVVLE